MAKEDGARLTRAKTAHFSRLISKQETLRTGIKDCSNYKPDFFLKKKKNIESFVISFAAVIVVCLHFERNLGTIIR